MPKKAKTACEMKSSENPPNPVLRPRGGEESCEDDTLHAIVPKNAPIKMMNHVKKMHSTLLC